MNRFPIISLLMLLCVILIIRIIYKAIRARQGDASDHGTHTIQLNPDGKMMSIISGNATRLTEYNRTRVYDNWGEDRLIMRPDLSPPGFHRAPEANILNFNADGTDVELWAMGMRNPVDQAFNKDGELFNGTLHPTSQS